MITFIACNEPLKAFDKNISIETENSIGCPFRGIFIDPRSGFAYFKINEFSVKRKKKKRKRKENKTFNIHFQHL